LVRKLREGVLPLAPAVAEEKLPGDDLISERIRLTGNLAGRHTEGDTCYLQVQEHSHLFLALVADAPSLDALRLGSKLSVTGVCVSTASRREASGNTPQFELLVNAPADVAILSQPSWWTLQRLLSVVGLLLLILSLAAVWIALLRRQVAQRSARLQQEIRERERMERQHALEAERTRIARDLHDDLGSGLTEMGMLASTGLNGSPVADQTNECFNRIAEKARTLVAGLDVIVWAIDPGRNSLQSFGDYLESYAEELLSASNLTCRFKIPIEFAAVSLSGTTRHSLLLAVKEALNNVIRHASAGEVELKMAQADGRLEITIADDGRGFDPQTVRPGDGLNNLHARMTALRGNCRIESVPGKGTTIKLSLPLPDNEACLD
jgi:signal transduction histidine kinase